MANPIQLGGVGQTVEIDERMLIRRKANMGQVERKQLVRYIFLNNFARLF